MGGIVSSLVGGESTAEAAAAAEVASDSRVLVFHSSNRWLLHFNNLKQSNQLLVVNFTASWCGPCKFIAPAIDAMANQFTDVEFAKIDVDQLQDVSREFSVQAMPTFVLLKQGKEVDRVVGAKKDELQKKIVTHRS